MIFSCLQLSNEIKHALLRMLFVGGLAMLELKVVNDPVNPSHYELGSRLGFLAVLATT